MQVPLIMMMAENGQVHHCHDEVVGRFQHDGVTYVVTSGAVAYISHALLDLRTGLMGEMWLSNEQVKVLRQQSDIDQPTPRIFDLPTIGLPPYTTIRGPSKIEGYTSPNSTVSVVQDSGGHWWSGSGQNNYVRPFYDHTTKDQLNRPELRFLFPWLRHISDTEEVWYSSNWQGPGSTATRLTLCTAKVAKVISESGVWGHYFPEGDARIEPLVALEESTAHRIGMTDIQGLRDALAAAKMATEADHAEITRQTDHQVSLTNQLAEARKRIKTAEDAVTQSQEQFASATRLLSDAEDRIEHLERDSLDPDRPFDLDRV